MKVLYKLFALLLFVLGGCASEPHLYSGFDPNAIMKYGYPQQEEWARIRGERKPIEASPICKSKEFQELTGWAVGLGGKCEFTENSCYCESQSGISNETRPRINTVQGSSAIMRKVAEKTVKTFDCPTAYAERREFRLQVDTVDNWGWTFEIRHECSTR